MYLLKVSIILGIVYTIYFLLLKKTNLAEYHRWYFLGGILFAIILPTITIEHTEIREIPIVTQTMISEAEASQPSYQKVTDDTFSWLDLVPILYWSVVGFLLLRFIVNLISVTRHLKQTYPDIFDGLTYHRSNEKIMPFSFFTFIVCNPSLFSNEELKLIFKHENVHVLGRHTWDLIIAELFAIFLWFNPIAWLLKKSIGENLEFIADASATTYSNSKINYQKLLLKTTLGNQSPVLSSTFFNSIIKKRIVMLQQPKSSKAHLLKYVLLIPMFAIFIFTFNATTVYIDKPIETLPQQSPQDQNVLRFTVSKTTTEKQMATISELLKKEGATITFKGIERDRNGYITSIEITYKSNTSSGNFNQNNDQPIKDIIIEMDRETKGISFKSSKHSMSQTFEVEKGKPLSKIKADTLVFISKDSSDVRVIGSDNGSNVYVYRTNSPHAYSIVQNDSTEKIMVWNSDKISSTEEGVKFNFVATGDSKFVWRQDSTHTIKGDKVIIYNGTKANSSKSPKAIKLEGTSGDKFFMVKDSDDNTQSVKGYTIRKQNDGVFFIRDGKGLNTFKIDKNTKKSELDELSKNLDDEGLKVKFSKVRRNSDGEIIQLKINLENEEGNKASAINKGKDGIPSIYFGQNGDGLFIKSN